jgi:hypothetical protein
VTEKKRRAPGAGRPPRVPGTASRARSVKYTDAEWESVKAAAEADNLPVADWVRRVVLAAVANKRRGWKDHKV